MKKRFFLLTTIIFLSSLTYSATVEESLNSIEESLNSIEAKFNDLLKKEEARKEQLRAESVVLEKEVTELKVLQEGKEKTFEKLEKDSEVRWYRDEYKKVLNQYDNYYEQIEKSITEKETKIEEIRQILEIMG
ncbi:MAG: adhesion protein FadA [Leptotrichiaceae bacterium]|jgi:outer membrane lipoprotein-sorting protein